MARYMEARTSLNEELIKKAIETNDWSLNSPFAAEERIFLEAIKIIKTKKYDKELFMNRN